MGGKGCVCLSAQKRESALLADGSEARLECEAVAIGV